MQEALLSTDSIHSSEVKLHPIDYHVGPFPRDVVEDIFSNDSTGWVYTDVHRFSFPVVSKPL